MATIKEYPLVIADLESMVRSSGYRNVHHEVTEALSRFPLPGWTRVTGCHIHFETTSTIDPVWASMQIQAMRLRPATLHELAVFGEQHPDGERGFSTVALGSIWTGGGDRAWMGHLWECPDGRDFSADWADVFWPSDTRFLAVLA
jgi:hypothetical protein